MLQIVYLVLFDIWFKLSNDMTTSFRDSLSFPKEPKFFRMPKTRQMKPFAGEEIPAIPSHHSTDTITGFTGYLPGIANTIGVRFPTQVKMSKSYVTDLERQRAGKPKPPTGKFASAPPVPPNSDRWGNFIMPNTVNQQLANTYLEALHPETPLDKSHGVGIPLNRSPSRSPMSQSSPKRDFGDSLITADPAKLERKASAPRRVQGYTGFRPKVSDLFGESFNRIELKSASPTPFVAMQRIPNSSLPKEMTYEALNYSPPRSRVQQ